MANPRGQQRDKPYRDALRMELAAAGEDQRELRAIARAHIRAAAGGDMSAIKELADRLDGKPVQATEITGDVQSYIVRMPSPISTLQEWDKHAQATLEQDKAKH
jgi:hypothetical protein